jgi:hypothetical protein
MLKFVYRILSGLFFNSGAGLEGGEEGFLSPFTAYDLEIFSALSSGSFYFIAVALVMVLKQWGLGLIQFQPFVNLN